MASIAELPPAPITRKAMSMATLKAAAAMIKLQIVKIVVAMRKQIFLPTISEIGDQTNGSIPCAKI